jgi:hypothetical protein
MTGKGLAFLLLVSMAAGCSGPRIRLVHRETGHVVECTASDQQPSNRSKTSIQRAVESCARQWESIGYVRGEKLPPEQRAVVNAVRLN